MFEGLFQPVHLLIVLGIMLLVFGPKRLPDLGKGMGEAIRGFKKGLSEGPSESASATETAPKSKTEGQS